MDHTTMLRKSGGHLRAFMAASASSFSRQGKFHRTSSVTNKLIFVDHLMDNHSLSSHPGSSSMLHTHTQTPPHGSFYPSMNKTCIALGKVNAKMTRSSAANTANGSSTIRNRQGDIIVLQEKRSNTNNTIHIHQRSSMPLYSVVSLASRSTTGIPDASSAMCFSSFVPMKMSRSSQIKLTEDILHPKKAHLQVHEVGVESVVAIVPLQSGSGVTTIESKAFACAAVLMAALNWPAGKEAYADEKTNTASFYSQFAAPDSEIKHDHAFSDNVALDLETSNPRLIHPAHVHAQNSSSSVNSELETLTRNLFTHTQELVSVTPSSLSKKQLVDRLDSIRADIAKIADVFLKCDQDNDQTRIVAQHAAFFSSWLQAAQQLNVWMSTCLSKKVLDDEEQVKNSGKDKNAQLAQKPATVNDLTIDFTNDLSHSHIHAQHSYHDPLTIAWQLQADLYRLIDDASKNSSFHTSLLNAGVLNVIRNTVFLTSSSLAPKDPWYVRFKNYWSSSNAAPSKTTTKEQDLLSFDLSLDSQWLAQNTKSNTDAQRKEYTSLTLYHASRSIMNLAKNTHCHQQILASNVLTPLIESAKNGIFDLGSSFYIPYHRTIALTLAALCNTVSANDLHKKNALQLLLDYATTTQDEKILTCATGAIFNLTKIESNHRFLVKRGVLPVLAHVITTRNTLAVESTSSLSSSAVVSSSTSSFLRAQRFAFLSLDELASSKDLKAPLIRSKMVQANIFTALADFLGSGATLVASQQDDGAAINAACRLVEIIAAAPSYEKAKATALEHLEQGGIVSSMIYLAKSGKPKLTISALNLLASMVESSKNSAEQAFASGAVPLIISSIGSLDRNIAISALHTLAKLSTDESKHDQLRRAGALSVLISTQSSPPPSSSMGAIYIAETLANFSRNSRMRTEIAHEGGLKVLLRLAASTSPSTLDKDEKNENSRKTLEEVTRALYNLSLEGISRIIVAQGGGLVPLATMTSSTNPKTKLYAVGAIASISEIFDYCPKIIENGALPGLVRCVQDRGLLGKWATLCLAQITNLQELHGSLADAGACAALLSVITRSSADIELQQYAILGLANLAATEASRPAMLKAKADSIFSALSRSQMTSPDIVGVAMVALKNLLSGGHVLTHVQPVSKLPPK